MQPELISARGLCHAYNSVEVLSDLTFSMLRGDYIGLVGPNGSGKSTLVKLILGLEAPSQGSITVFGQAHKDLKAWDKIGYLPQKINFFNPHFPSTVREIVELGLISRRHSRLARAERRAAVDQALELLGIGDLAKRLIGDLSGGQQQRVFIARALVSRPELLILDEPATALDPETRDNFFSLLHDLNHRDSVSVILVTHDIGSIGEFASKLMFLDKRIIFFGSFDEFCLSDTMTKVFGPSSQHIICHKHD
ncbi:MAG: metal ABC transporter ATP-binding protein [Nitrospirae bacterium]|nr:MAG: metal ABC transporter ATP-binding protein [Nitrospirota bacterium]